MIGPEVPATKVAVREAVREVEGGFPRWVELQALVYGPEITRAKPAPGVEAFLLVCKEQGVPVSIISHKTKTPALGFQSNLHDAARGFMEQHGFFGRLGVDPSAVSFHPDRPQKVATVERRGCSHFIDDLPEVFQEPGFPSGVEQILYRREPAADLPDGVVQLAEWSAIQARLFG